MYTSSHLLWPPYIHIQHTPPLPPNPGCTNDFRWACGLGAGTKCDGRPHNVRDMPGTWVSSVYLTLQVALKPLIVNLV